jgi:hypothetical protein
MISLLISLQSKKYCEALRANSILQLPHPKYLQQLTSSLKVSPGKSLQNNHFLKVISSKLSDLEKWVVLEAEEIQSLQSMATVKYFKNTFLGIFEIWYGVKSI